MTNSNSITRLSAINSNLGLFSAYLLSTALLCTALLSKEAAAETDDPFAPIIAAEYLPKNIIYLIGDGMGPAYTSAYRYYSDNPQTQRVEKTIFDKLLVGMSSTYPDDDTYVTDSAAAATALATSY
ncbi:hypothetical protein TUM3792_46140 [Shewanella sp. MBTL60-007]|nr:hypothetical protein TUM3792_46140 [Shewanella sp. MBTL60-007]